MGCKGGFLAVIGFFGETLPIVIFIFDGVLVLVKGVGAGCVFLTVRPPSLLAVAICLRLAIFIWFWRALFAIFLTVSILVACDFTLRCSPAFCFALLSFNLLALLRASAFFCFLFF